jgi:Ca-activated chloride channel family protein
VTPPSARNQRSTSIRAGLGGRRSSRDELKQPGFDKLDRKHPVVRFLALDDVNIASGHKLVPQAGDKVWASGGRRLADSRGRRRAAGNKFVALGFDVRDSDLPLRPAWPLFVS